MSIKTDRKLAVSAAIQAQLGVDTVHGDKLAQLVSMLSDDIELVSQVTELVVVARSDTAREFVASVVDHLHASPISHRQFRLIKSGVCPFCYSELSFTGYCSQCHLVPAHD
jgi:hypothetical protein